MDGFLFFFIVVLNLFFSTCALMTFDFIKLFFCFLLAFVAICLVFLRILCKIFGFFFAGEFVAQFKVTVILMPNGPLKITGLPFEPEAYQTEYKIEDEDVKVRHNRSLAVGQSLLLCIFGICL